MRMILPASIVLLVVVATACGKEKAAAPPAAPPPPSASPAPVGPGPASPAPLSDAAAQPAAAPAQQPAAPAASTDIDNPTPLPAKEIKGTGIKKQVTYYYGFNAAAGAITVTATAKNVLSGFTHALTAVVQDSAGKKFCQAGIGNTTKDKTSTAACQVDKAQPLILRLDVGDETIDYTVALDGPVELPPPGPPTSTSQRG